MKKNYTFTNLTKQRKAKENVFRNHNEGITKKLIEKYKPSTNLQPLDYEKQKKEDERRAA
tara:strand:+ start:410 stop:589 length:180 start_codon:yes stop_codon:yes gene_type:complete